jgi:4-cresol dehydrogenase (hydroxylating) flavoprotein subunit
MTAIIPPVTALSLPISEWISILGPKNVNAEAAYCETAGTASFESSTKVGAVLFPGSVEEVIKCLDIARRYRVALYPVSTGKNWGYTSGAPTSDAVLLNLSRMNRILDFNEELGYAIIEPGVTQRQLFDFLRSRGSKLWIDATGASPDCSILGNTVERGFGHTPYSDHFAHSCNLQVVLPSGEVIQTGMGEMPGAKTASLYRWGVGPFVDGLFSQSNLGIVTRMTVWLMPAPECVEAFFFKIDRDEDLPQLIDALRPLRMDGTLKSACHIGNDYKVLGGLQPYPWQETDGVTPLQPETLAQIAQKLNFGAWNGSGALYGTKRQVAEARRLVRLALKGKVQRLKFLDERKLHLAMRFAKVARMFTKWDLSQTLELLRPLFGLIQGVPTDQPMKSCYWRKPGFNAATCDSSTLNPDRDRCGLIWCSPLAPLSGSHVHEMTKICISTLLEYKFEPMISLTIMTERTVGCVVSIIYDRDIEGEDERARLCHEALLGRLAASGYYPYRLGIQSMGVMEHTGPLGGFLKRIKEHLDPQHILAPGRYEA